MKLSKEVRGKNYSKLLNEITTTEFFNIMDEDWTYDNDSLEASMFRNFSNEQKEVYALSQAKQFATEAMNLSDTDFHNLFGDMFDEVIN